jgi:hypothetical protein
MWGYNPTTIPWYDIKDNITAIVFNGNITKIGHNAFYACTILPSVTIPASVNELGNNVFKDCSKLATVTVVDKTVALKFEGIGSYALHFSNCPIEILYIGRNIDASTWYNKSPFNENSRLKQVAIGEQVTSINADSFYNCDSLQLLTFNGNEITSIGDNSFSGCSRLSGALTIPNKVKTIGHSAFYGCKSLSTVTIPSSVEVVGNTAFKDCSKLKVVIIADKTIALKFDGIGSYAFHFYNCPIDTLYLGRDIDASTWYNKCPFSENSRLKKVTIGEDVTTINANSFYNCDSLQLLTFNGNEITSIGENSFSGCNRLSGVLTIPNKVKTIGGSAFENCKRLPSVTFPKSVTSIGNSAFSGCSGLTEITSNPTIPPTIYNNTFNGVDKSIPVIIDCDYLSDYKSANYWKDFTNYQCLVPVTDIILNVPAIITVGVPVALSGTVEPSNATNKDIIWSVEDAGTTGAKIEGNILTTEFEGAFTIKATVYNGKSSDFIKIFPFNSVLDIADFTLSKIAIYPNPTTGELKIESREWRIEEIRIFDIYGREQKEKNRMQKAEGEIVLDISELSAGIYFVKIFTEVGEVVRKVVKE